MKFKKFHGDIDSVDYDDLDNYDYNYDFADDDEYRKIGSIRTLFKELDSDYYKPIRTDGGFAGRNNNYIEYTSKGDRYENLSPEEYLDMIRPYLRNLINDHKPTMELTNKANNSVTKRGEWRFQLVMQNNCIYSKSFEDTRTIYSASKSVEVFMGSNTDNIIDKIFDTILQRFQEAQETSHKIGIEFMHESVALLYYENMKIDMERTESYIASPDWLRNKGATINPRNKDDNKCFQYAITLALTYNKIRKKELKSIPKKIKQVNIYFSSYQKDWEKFEQNNTSIALNVLFSSQNNEEIKLAYKSEHSFKRENTMVLSMTNDNDNDYDDEKYYFAVKSKAELFASEWLRSKKEAIINGGNGFQNALNDALDYQKNKRDPQKTLKIEPYISK